MKNSLQCFWVQRVLLVLSTFFFFFDHFRATPSAYGGSQARGQSCSRWPTPQPQQHQIQALSATYTTAHGNTGSSAHWARPGIEPATSWFLVGFVSTAPRQELPSFLLLPGGQTLRWCWQFGSVIQYLPPWAWQSHEKSDTKQIIKNYKRVPWWPSG